MTITPTLIPTQEFNLRHHFVTRLCHNTLCYAGYVVRYLGNSVMQRFLLFHFLLWSCFRSNENWMLNSLCSQYSFWITLQSPSSNKELENLYKNILPKLTFKAHFFPGFTNYIFRQPWMYKEEWFLVFRIYIFILDDFLKLIKDKRGKV